MSHKLKIKQIDGAGLGGQPFESNLVVQLPPGKSFGRFVNGQTIQAAGLTANEVIQLAIVEALNPTIGLTSPTTVNFNDTNPSIVLNRIGAILSGGASLDSASIDRRRNNAGDWVNIGTFGTPASPPTYTDTFTDTPFNTATINYRYVLTDTAGGSSTAFLNFAPTYVQPTISLTVTASSVLSPETSLSREKGNVSSSLSGTITRNSPLVNLTSAVFQYQVNGAGLWTDIGSPTSISGSSAIIGPVTHNDSALKGSNSISYRIKVIDTYQTHLGLFLTGGDTTVNFKNLIFYGPVASAPNNSAAIRALGSKIFADGANPFNLLTGMSLRTFTVALPQPKTVVSVFDLDALSLNITNQYLLGTIAVDDAGGTSTAYNVYTMTNATPYSDTSHRHQITRS